MGPDEHEQSAEMRDPVLRPRALRYSVAYVPMPEDVAGRYMHRKGREEDAYRAACGREFHLDLFPPRLKVRPSLFYCLYGPRGLTSHLPGGRIPWRFPTPLTATRTTTRPTRPSNATATAQVPTKR